MGKILMGPQMVLGIRPLFLVGANVNDKPNFMTVVAGGHANAEPPMISVAIAHHRYTLRGIRQNMTFSVNIPSLDLVEEADYCGLASGAKVDKVAVCRFKVFYGKLNSAPLIEQCPVNLECNVVHILDLGSHSLIVGRVEETYISESCLTDGKPDVNKIKPFLFTSEPDRKYLAIGQFIAKTGSVGRGLKARE